MLKRASNRASEYHSERIEHILGTCRPESRFIDEFKERLNTLIISHEVVRKIQGGLHKDTGYGKVCGTENLYVTRKPLSIINSKNIDQIRDAAVRTLVWERLKAYDEDPKAAFGEPLYHKDSKTRIETVRMTEVSSPTGI
jgi:CRISPR/Cas system Type II protein with McrA/HNH and RuvC-like nuclease domain